METIAAAIGEGFQAGIGVLRSESPGHSPFRILIATLISLRTRDEVTIPASRRLFALGDTPADIAALAPRVIEEQIFPAGFYRTKAQRILQICTQLLEKHQGNVPHTREELLALPGVGRKTANLVLGEGFGIPAICVDIHVHRIANRCGWVTTDTPEQTEGELERTLPEKYWIPVNQLLVGFGQQVCTPGKPRCSQCPLAGWCPRVGVTGSR